MEWDRGVVLVLLVRRGGLDGLESVWDTSRVELIINRACEAALGFSRYIR